MDLIPNSAKSPEPEPDTPTRIHFAKPVSFTNGVLKRQIHQAPPTPSAASAAVAYKECLKNHAASLGGHALDGCGEFMPSPSATETDPTSIKCAACGCHRNFHRRDPDDSPPPSTPAPPATHVIEYQPHHRHHPPHPPPPRSPDSASPPPISSSYYGHHHHSAAPHVLLTLSNAVARDGPNPPPPGAAMVSPLSRKRFRTKFSQTQKERMFEFAERVGWRFQKRDDDIIHEFCNQIGVDRSVLKVWMHNNKNTLGKRSSDHQNSLPNINNAAVPPIPTDTDNNVNSSEDFDTPTTTFNQTSKSEANGGYHHSHAGTNGSYSSS